jgi:hypothetical protein
MDFEQLKEKAAQAAELIAAGRELAAEVLENVAAASMAMTLHEKNEITAMLSSVTRESEALNRRIQHG